MKNKRGQIRNFEEGFKALVSLIVGIIMISAIVSVSPPETMQIFKDVGAWLIVVGIITLIISLANKR